MTRTIRGPWILCAFVAIAIPASSLAGPSRLYPPTEKQNDVLRVAKVMQLATREEILDLGVHYDTLVASGIRDSDLSDGSLATGQVYCCGGPSDEGMAMWIYVPAGMAVEVGDIVEVRMGHQPRGDDPGLVNTAIRIRVKKDVTDGPCRWMPRDETLWTRILYCDWMEEEGWIREKGFHKTWLKRDPKKIAVLDSSQHTEQPSDIPQTVDVPEALKAASAVPTQLPEKLVGEPANPSEHGPLVMGNDDAPLVLDLYTDFACSFCARFHQETFPLILEQYIQTGKLLFRYHAFPFKRGIFYGLRHKAKTRHSFRAAGAAQCAAEQGVDEFWRFYDTLMANQRSLKKADYEEAATEADLDLEPFAQCLASERWVESVWQELEAGRAAGVQAVPTFYLNGDRIAGAQPYEVFKDAFEKKLREMGEQ